MVLLTGEMFATLSTLTENASCTFYVSNHFPHKNLSIIVSVNINSLTLLYEKYPKQTVMDPSPF